MEEELRPIPGFPNYLVTKTGEVYSINGNKLNQYVNQKGYCKVDLSTNGQRSKKWVHRLVAAAFIPNPLGLPQINHKDENPNNNNVENLEWCDAKYNSNYGHHKERIGNAHRGKRLSAEVKKKLSEAHKGREPTAATAAAKKRNSKPVAQYIDGTLIAQYPSAHEAYRRTGINYVHICDCCRGDRNTAGGYSWQYTKGEIAS